MWGNTDQNNSEYGHFSRSGVDVIVLKTSKRLKYGFSQIALSSEEPVNFLKSQLRSLVAHKNTGFYA